MSKRAWNIDPSHTRKYKFILIAVWAVILIACFLNRDRFSVDGVLRYSPRNPLLAAVFMLLLFALNPCLAGRHDSHAVDVKLKHIVVGELHPEIFFEIVGREADSAAHVDVGVCGGPGMADVGIFAGGAPCGLFKRP